jgi:hypothetical protein
MTLEYHVLTSLPMICCTYLWLSLQQQFHYFISLKKHYYSNKKIFLNIPLCFQTNFQNVWAIREMWAAHNSNYEGCCFMECDSIQSVDTGQCFRRTWCLILHAITFLMQTAGSAETITIHTTLNYSQSY